MTASVGTALPGAYDRRDALVEVHAGTVQSVAFGRTLAGMYQAFARRQGWRVHQVWPFPRLGSTSAVLDAMYRVAGTDAYGTLKYEDGVHELLETTDAQQGSTPRSTTASVVVLPGAEEDEIDMRPEDIRLDLFRHADDPDLGITATHPVLRVTHLPTGVQVWYCPAPPPRSTDSLDSCRFALSARLLDYHRSGKLVHHDPCVAPAPPTSRRRHGGRSGDCGSHCAQAGEIIRTFDVHQDRVIDRRLAEPISGVAEILEGGLDALIIGLMVREDAP